MRNLPSKYIFQQKYIEQHISGNEWYHDFGNSNPFDHNWQYYENDKRKEMVCHICYKQVIQWKMENLNNEERARLIANDCKPCTNDFYEGMYSGILITLEAQDLEKQEKQIKPKKFFSRCKIAFNYIFKKQIILEI